MNKSPIETVMEYVIGDYKHAYGSTVTNYGDVAVAMLTAQQNFEQYTVAFNFISGNIQLDDARSATLVRDLTGHFSSASGLAWNIAIGSMAAHRDNEPFDLENIQSSLARVAPAGFMINLLVEMIGQARGRTEINIGETGAQLSDVWRVNSVLVPSVYVPTNGTLRYMAFARCCAHNYRPFDDSQRKLYEQITPLISRELLPA